MKDGGGYQVAFEMDKESVYCEEDKQWTLLYVGGLWAKGTELTTTMGPWWITVGYSCSTTVELWDCGIV